MFALFKDGRQISKPHSTKAAVMIEAVEKKAVIRIGREYELAKGYEVRGITTAEAAAARGASGRQDEE